MKGVFAWVTCPKVLQQFERDMRICNKDFKLNAIPANPNDGECYLLTEDSKVTIPNGQHKSVLLEEYAFKVQSVQTINVIEAQGQERGEMNLHGWLACYTSEQTFFQDKMMEDIVILSNDDFKDFVNLSTEVITRTAIDNDKGTVKPGALFTEEFLPAESVMYSLVMASPLFVDNKAKEGERSKKAKVIDEINAIQGITATDDEDKKVLAAFIKNLPSVMQIGGNATLGKGIVRTKIN